MENKLKLIDEKKKKLDRFKPFNPALVKNLEEWFKVELTYTSNAIEGNTLTRQETALIVEKGLTVAGKSLKEHLEAINHAEALDFIKQFVNKKRQDITQRTILDIHEIILKKIDDTNAGRYRNVSVRIAGSIVALPNPAKVHNLMKEFIEWLNGKSKDHPVKISADAHFKLVSIHPFIDGNGRVARLLMNLLFMQNGYPPALIRKEDRIRYINSIEKAQLYGDSEDYYHIMYDAVIRSLDVYLSTLKGKAEKIKIEKQKLLKIGELAKIAGENVPAIRYWTKEGLLEVAEYTQGGYHLYSPSMIEIIKKIRKLQKEKRLTIKEIKAL